MKFAKFLFLIALLQLYITISTCTINASKDNRPTLLPYPRTIKYGTNILPVVYPFEIISSSPFPQLTESIKRYQQLIFSHHTQTQENTIQTTSHDTSSLIALVISVENVTSELSVDMDESYTLEFKSIQLQENNKIKNKLTTTQSIKKILSSFKKRFRTLTFSSNTEDNSEIIDFGTFDKSTDYIAEIKSNTYFGALHGLETFSQLINYNYTTLSYYLTHFPLSIQDYPRFQHRGLLIDTARHYQPIINLKLLIDSLSFAKLNVLHWHISDIESFPFESKTSPKLWNAAFSNEEKYSQQDVHDIVEYAANRGIRVMIEFDVPGHADSWCIAYPEVCPSDSCHSPLDPTSNRTFEIMKNLFDEVSQPQSEWNNQPLFPDTMFHLGGDEVDTSCWSNTQHISNWLKEKNYTTNDAYRFMVQSAHDIVLSNNRDPVNWEEVFNAFGDKLNKRTIIHIWLDKNTLKRAVQLGYRTLLSDQDKWYLDHLNTKWQKFYNNEPLEGIDDKQLQKLVLGGEVCMWGETVDASDLFNTVWPRAAAAAERLWSNRELIDEKFAEYRLSYFRCLLTRRGINAAPLNNDDARQAPPHYGSCYQQ